MQWMIMPLRRYAEFTGRSRRMEFWMFGLFNLIVYAVLFAIAFGAGLGANFQGVDASNPLAIYGAFFSGAGLLIAVWWLAMVIPSISVSVRRLHDRDMSGWWYLGIIVASLIPIVGGIAGIVMLVIFCLPGTPGPNRFGPDPKDPTSAEVFA